MTNEAQIQGLLQRYMQNSSTPQETEQLLQLIANTTDPELWQRLVNNVAAGQPVMPPADPAVWAPFVQNIVTLARSAENEFTPTADLKPAASDLPAVELLHGVHFLRTAWFRYAAVLLLIAGTATFLYLRHQPQEQAAQIQSTKQPDILPGGNKAILTLSDGNTIILDSAANGSLASQGNMQIIKLNAGSLAYKQGGAASSSVTGEVLYNTISTPKGGQYQIALPDGSKVWLNAASSITYPTCFTGPLRKVKISGEAYFEVAKAPDQPFIVQTYQDEIRVLGTSFNVNSYKDEPGIKTSLVEGRVRINEQVLQPGEAYFKGKIIKTNIEQDIAWKNSVFNFNKTDLPAVLRQISRWYDIEVLYSGMIPQEMYQGKLSKDLTLTEVLRILKTVGITFQVKDRVLIVKGK
jgi:ferric-dicitrate binding protein FerR (iron transport regulator)